MAGYEIENQTCNAFECAVNGTWSEWGLWTNCSADCGPGTQQRQRSCDNIVGDGEDCPGNEKDFMICTLKECEGWSILLKQIVLVLRNVFL